MMVIAITLGIHLASSHAPSSYDEMRVAANEFGHRLVITVRERYRTATPGLYLVMPSGFTVGALSNSFGKASLYAGWTWESSSRTFAITGALATGYPHRALQPMLMPSVRIALGDNAALRIGVMPGGNKPNHPTVVHAAIEVDL